jgi:hypothetical protein
MKASLDCREANAAWAGVRLCGARAGARLTFPGRLRIPACPGDAPVWVERRKASIAVSGSPAARYSRHGAALQRACQRVVSRQPSCVALAQGSTYRCGKLRQWSPMAGVITVAESVAAFARDVLKCDHLFRLLYGPPSDLPLILPRRTLRVSAPTRSPLKRAGTLVQTVAFCLIRTSKLIPMISSDILPFLVTSFFKVSYTVLGSDALAWPGSSSWADRQQLREVDHRWQRDAGAHRAGT